MKDQHVDLKNISGNGFTFWIFEHVGDTRGTRYSMHIDAEGLATAFQVNSLSAENVKTIAELMLAQLAEGLDSG